MNNREHFELLQKNGINNTAKEDRIQALGQILVDSLFKPSLKHQRNVDFVRVAEFGIDRKEPINWGGFGCYVEIIGGIYTLILDECAPDNCPTLCEYFRSHLKAWGWGDVDVITEF